MVDIHAHILPGIDDGPATWDESLEMLRLAAANGTTDIVATPHASREFPYDSARIQEAYSRLAQETSGFIRVYLGCDFHLSADNLQDALRHPDKYTINNGRYLMVELPDWFSFSGLTDPLRKLRDARITPIITHPERNPSILPRPRDLHAWIKDGCLIQITGQSLLGRFGREAQKAADKLLDWGMVHFVASDAHNLHDRTPDLSEAYNHVRARFGVAAADRLFVVNPRNAVSGDLIDYVIGGRPGKFGWLSRFFR
jgi:protein-tyrosine phosphatase